MKQVKSEYDIALRRAEKAEKEVRRKGTNIDLALIEFAAAAKDFARLAKVEMEKLLEEIRHE